MAGLKRERLATIPQVPIPGCRTMQSRPISRACKSSTMATTPAIRAACSTDHDRARRFPGRIADILAPKRQIDI